MRHAFRALRHRNFAYFAAGQSIAGPALIEERETTTVILPGWSATVHATGCVIAERKA